MENFHTLEINLKLLFTYTKHAYKGFTFEQWTKETKKAYLSFSEGKKNVKTFSQWVNGQIIALTECI